jgi:hypothetical protein
VVLRTVESLWVPGITLSLAVGLAGSFLSSKPFEVFGSAARFVPTSPVGPDRQKERRGESTASTRVSGTLLARDLAHCSAA